MNLQFEDWWDEQPLSKSPSHILFKEIALLAWNAALELNNQGEPTDEEYNAYEIGMDILHSMPHRKAHKKS